jgi:hypothetical protein
MKSLIPSENLVTVSCENRIPDNQQERLKTIGWIVGYVDGEGCFSVSFIRNATMKSGWQIFPEFVITQGEKSRDSLETIQKFFQCGRIYVNRRYDNHRENIYRYCVRSKKELSETIIPFFKENPLRTAKKEDFENFCIILDMLHQGRHLSENGREAIAKVVEKMNRKKSSRFLESSETECSNSTVVVE